MQAIRRAHALRRAVVAATSRSARSAALWRAAAPATRFEPACGVRSARTGLWSVRGLSTTAATRGAAEFPRSDLFSHAAFEADAAATASCDRVVFRTQAQAEQETGLSLDAGSVALAQQPRGASEPLLLVANVGKIAKDADEAAVSAQLRKAATAAVQWLARHQRTSVAVEFPPDVGLAPEDAAGVVTQATLLASYTFPKYLSPPTQAELDDGAKPQHTFERFSFVSVAGASGEQSALLAGAVDTAKALCNATAMARDLATDRADVVTPLFMAEVAAQLATEFEAVSVSVMEEAELLEKGLNLLAAVGQGAHRATHKPRLVTIEYRGAPDRSDTQIAFVGKGITYDTGGLNLKPTGFIEDMHADMSGSAAVTAAMRAIATLQLPINVVATIPLAENCVGANAYKPHAIIKSYKGLTVEINNTDAEGRLALVDAMTHVQREYKPATMVDMATLTGACVVALGEPIAGLFGNDKSLSDDLVAAGDARFERCWPMPVLPEHSAELASKIADTRSTGTSRSAGACTAAAFLKRFVEDGVKWAHVDIAGPAMPSNSPTYSGFGAQLLTEYAMRCAREQ